MKEEKMTETNIKSENKSNFLIITNEIITELNNGNLNGTYQGNISNSNKEKWSYLAAAIELKNTPNIDENSKERIELAIKIAIENANAMKINTNIGHFKTSPLHTAVDNLDINIIKQLIDAKADLNIKNTFGNTPLMCAVTNESIVGDHDKINKLIKIISVLLENGASITIKNDFEENAIKRILPFKSHHQGYFNHIFDLLQNYETKIITNEPTENKFEEIEGSRDLTNILDDENTLDENTFETEFING